MSNPNCLLHNQAHDPHKLAGPGGNKPGAWCGGFKQVEARAICPDCVAGKHVNCLGDALDPVTDEIVGCACDHTPSGGTS